MSARWAKKRAYNNILYILLLKSCQDAALEHHLHKYENDDEIKRTIEMQVSSVCVLLDKYVNKIVFIQLSLFCKRKIMA